MLTTGWEQFGQATLGQGVVLPQSSQESSCYHHVHPIALGENAHMALFELWLLILDHPFTKALENKTSSEFQELRGLLTKWVM